MTKEHLLDKVQEVIDSPSWDEIREWNSVEGWNQFYEDLKIQIDQRQHNLKVFDEIRGGSR